MFIQFQEGRLKTEFKGIKNEDENFSFHGQRVKRTKLQL